MSKQENKKNDAVNIPDGFKPVSSAIPFIVLKNKGDKFQGVFLESTISKSKGKFARENQIVWIAAATAEIGKTKDSKVSKGELYSIGEKTVMSNYRQQLHEGDEFYIEVLGDKTGENGTKYTEFIFGIKEK